jgi:Leucine Rich repeat
MSSNIARLLIDRSKSIEQRAAEVAELLPTSDTLYLRLSNIGSDGAKALSAALPRMISLVTLDLSGNNIGAEGAKALSTALPMITRWLL